MPPEDTAGVIGLMYESEVNVTQKCSMSIDNKIYFMHMKYCVI